MTAFTGWKTYVAGAGLILWGLVLILHQHPEQGVQAILQGFGLIGLRHHTARIEGSGAGATVAGMLPGLLTIFRGGNVERLLRVMGYVTAAQDADADLKRLKPGETGTVLLPEDMFPDLKSRGSKVFEVVAVVVKRKK